MRSWYNMSMIGKGGTVLFPQRLNMASFSCFSVMIPIGLALFLCVSDALADQAILSWQASTKSADGTLLTDLTSASVPLTASFSANPANGSAPLNVAFTDISSGPVTAWLWDFGDGSSSRTQHPNHTYTTPGDYTVSLTVFDTTTSSTAQISLAWDASSDPNVGGYVLHYGTQSGAYTQQVDVGNQTTAILSDLATGLSYFFAVSAYDQNGGNESGFSNEVSTSLPAASAADTASTTITVLSSPPSTALAPAPPGRLRGKPF